MVGQLKNHKMYKLQVEYEQKLTRSKRSLKSRKRDSEQEHEGMEESEETPIGTSSWGQLSKFISLRAHLLRGQWDRYV